MKCVLIRLATAAASCTVAIGYLAFPAAAATPAPPPSPPANVITIPSPDQVTDGVNAFRCPWLMAYAAALTASATQASDAARHALNTGTAASYATLPKTPLVAALCGMAGN